MHGMMEKFNSNIITNMKSKFNKNELIHKAINNIEQDRKNAQELLEDVAEFIGEAKERYASTGVVAAKYLETLQRSNEQLVKLISLMKKNEQDEYGDLDEKDKENLYDEIEESKDG